MSDPTTTGPVTTGPWAALAIRLHDAQADLSDIVMEAYLLGIETGAKRARPPVEQPAPTIRIVTWDWREQPDLAELRDILTPHGIHLVQAATGDDQYAVAISTAPISQDQADEAYRTRFEGEAS
jgi:hypothetical protein